MIYHFKIHRHKIYQFKIHRHKIHQALKTSKWEKVTYSLICIKKSLQWKCWFYYTSKSIKLVY